MTSAPSGVGDKLARVLADFRQRDAVLRAARLPVDVRSRTIFDNGLLRIKREYAQWGARREDPDRDKAFTAIAKAANNLQAAFRNDAGLRAVSVMEKQAVWRPPIEITLLDEKLAALHETALFYNRIYGYKPKMRRRSTERTNFVFHQLYRLLEEIKGASPGNTDLLYRFTMNCAELLDISIGFIQSGAFRMRVKRILDEQRKGLGSMGSVLTNMPPALAAELSSGPHAALGSLADAAGMIFPTSTV